MSFKATQAAVGSMLVVLGVATLGFFIGRTETVTDPRPENTLPSGLGAFAEVLRREGVEVAVDRRVRPALARSDLAVACTIQEHDVPPSAASDDVDTTVAALEGFVDRGGTVLELRFDQRFVETTRKASVGQVVGETKTMSVTVSSSQPLALTLRQPQVSFSLFTCGGEPFVSVDAFGDGTWVVASQAIGATNRFLGREDNAEFYTRLVRATLPPGGRVVFIEATTGHADPMGIIGEFGPWAVAAQWQVVLLLLVMAGTLGARFGLPVSDRVFRRGARQLADALAEIFRTGRQVAFCSAVVADRAVDRLCRSTGIAVTHDPERLSTVFGEDVASAYRMATGPLKGRRKEAERLQSLATFLKKVQDAEASARRRPGTSPKRIE